MAFANSFLSNLLSLKSKMVPGLRRDDNEQVREKQAGGFLVVRNITHYSFKLFPITFSASLDACGFSAKPKLA